MSDRQTAIDRYHDLAHSGSLAQETWGVLEPGMRERNLYFGDRPLCTVLRPLFHTEEEYAYLSRRTTLMLGVFAKASEAAMRDPKLLAQLALTPEERELVAIPTGYSTTIPTARLDSFFDRDAQGNYLLNYIEFNGESPASMGYSDVLAELFLETPLMARFQEFYAARNVQARPWATEALLRIYAQWKGNSSDRPRMAIVDWAGVPTEREFHILADWFARYGIQTVICTPDDLEFRNGKLYAGDQHVDFVYKRVLTTELLQRYGLDHPMIHALRAGAICLANPFTCKLLHKKASFALVSDEQNAHLFTQAERDAIRMHIPWTRVMAERYTLDSSGERVDLLPWAVRNQERLVLKPNDEYGGKGVLIGWECTHSDWERALEAALEEPSIIQERAHIAYEEFPRLNESGHVELGRRLVDCDPFLFHGDSMGGCLVRLSSVTLLNVTAGGGSVVPHFIVHER
jgi:glutathionylspermidine synthase